MSVKFKPINIPEEDRELELYIREIYEDIMTVSTYANKLGKTARLIIQCLYTTADEITNITAIDMDDDRVPKFIKELYREAEQINSEYNELNPPSYVSDYINDETWYLLKCLVKISRNYKYSDIVRQTLKLILNPQYLGHINNELPCFTTGLIPELIFDTPYGIYRGLNKDSPVSPLPKILKSTIMTIIRYREKILKLMERVFKICRSAFMMMDIRNKYIGEEGSFFIDSEIKLKMKDIEHFKRILNKYDVPNSYIEEIKQVQPLALSNSVLKMKPNMWY